MLGEIKEFHYMSDLHLLRLKKSGGKLFYVNKDYSYGFQAGKDVIIWAVPKGFASDGGSVPGILQSSVSVLGPAFEAYIIHDYLYWQGKYTRKECDLIFLAALNASETGWWQKKKIYAGVRLGGWVAWNTHRERDGR